MRWARRPAPARLHATAPLHGRMLGGALNEAASACLLAVRASWQRQGKKNKQSFGTGFSQPLGPSRCQHPVAGQRTGGDGAQTPCTPLPITCPHTFMQSSSSRSLQTAPLTAHITTSTPLGVSSPARVTLPFVLAARRRSARFRPGRRVCSRRFLHELLSLLRELRVLLPPLLDVVRVLYI